MYMNVYKYKKVIVLVCALLIALSTVACGQEKNDEAVSTDEPAVSQQESDSQSGESTDSEVKEDENVNTEEPSESQQESNGQVSESTDAEVTAEELLDLFISGSISAISSVDSTSTFYITDLDMDSGEWDSYSIGEKADLDNDGENELILCGPYGGIYLDARDNNVYEFAVGEGAALTLSYVVYNGATWVMYSNRMNAGYESYHMEKYEGADNLVAEMNFGEELVNEDDAEGEEKYTLNGTEISYDEYFELCSKILATEVNTD
jgi:hypothetical protein